MSDQREPWHLILATAICLAMPAHAQDTASFGGTGCVLVPVTGEAWVAEVNCLNVETTGNAWNEGAMTANGLTVGLTISHGPGDVPDVFTLIPPVGYVVHPEVMTLDELSTGQAVVLPYVGF